MVDTSRQVDTVSWYAKESEADHVFEIRGWFSRGTGNRNARALTVPKGSETRHGHMISESYLPNSVHISTSKSVDPATLISSFVIVIVNASATSTSQVHSHSCSPNLIITYRL